MAHRVADTQRGARNTGKRAATSMNAGGGGWQNPQVTRRTASHADHRRDPGPRSWFRPPTFVIPAYAGIQGTCGPPAPLDPRVRGDDGGQSCRPRRWTWPDPE